MAQDSHLDMPQQLRELTDRNFVQARSAMPSNEMTSGMKVIHQLAVLFAKQNGEACFAFASELVNARNLQDVVGIQSRYAQTQMQAYALQAQGLGRLMAEASHSMQPKS
jgi:hypothetical protein